MNDEDEALVAWLDELRKLRDATDDPPSGEEGQ